VTTTAIRRSAQHHRGVTGTPGAFVPPAVPAGYRLKYEWTPGTAFDSAEWTVGTGAGNAGNGRRVSSAVTFNATDPSTSGQVIRVRAQATQDPDLSWHLDSGIVFRKGASRSIRNSVRVISVRATQDATLTMSPVILAWPATGVWPFNGEDDWVEVGGGSATSTPAGFRRPGGYDHWSVDGVTSGTTANRPSGAGNLITFNNNLFHPTGVAQYSSIQNDATANEANSRFVGGFSSTTFAGCDIFVRYYAEWLPKTYVLSPTLPASGTVPLTPGYALEPRGTVDGVTAVTASLQPAGVQQDAVGKSQFVIPWESPAGISHYAAAKARWVTPDTSNVTRSVNVRLSSDRASMIRCQIGADRRLRIYKIAAGVQTELTTSTAGQPNSRVDPGAMATNDTLFWSLFANTDGSVSLRYATSAGGATLPTIDGLNAQTPALTIAASQITETAIPANGDIAFMLDAATGYATGSTIQNVYAGDYVAPVIEPFTYYVDPEAAAGGNGSSGAPWNTLAPASAVTLSPGQSIGIKRGTTMTGQLLITENGTSTGRITVGAYGTGAAPIISAGNQTRSTIDVTGDYVTIQDLDLRDSGVDNDGQENANASFFGAIHGIVQNCRLANGQIGVRFAGGSHFCRSTGNTFVSNNKMTVNAAGGDDDYGAHAHFIGASDDCEVDHNVSSGHVHTSFDYGYDGSFCEVFGGSRTNIHHNHTEGDLAAVELGKNSGGTAVDNVIRYNLFHATAAVGGGGAAGVVTRGVDTFGPVLRTLVEHNTIHMEGTADNAAAITVVGTVSTDFVVRPRNNILVCGNNAIWCSPGQGAMVQASFNLSQGGHTNTPIGAGSLRVSPQWVSAGTNYHLTSTSPAINAGLSGLGQTEDIEGNPIVNAPDMGAYEYQTPVTPAAPGAPTGVTGTVGNAAVNVFFTPPASQGSAPVTVYTVTRYVGGVASGTQTGDSSPISIASAAHTAATFTVKATNSVGTSPESTASAAVTPLTPGDVMWSDTFESGNPSADGWTNSNTSAFVPTGSGRGGTGRGWTLTTTDSGLFTSHPTASPGLSLDMTVGVWWSHSAAPTHSIRLCGLQTAAGSLILEVNLLGTDSGTDAGKVEVLDAGFSRVGLSGVVSTGSTGHFLSIRPIVAALPTSNNGSLEVRIDGTAFFGPSTTVQLGGEAVGSLNIGDFIGGPGIGATIHWDDPQQVFAAWPTWS
jgi:hypothetical protein